MVVQKTIDNLKGRPKDEKTAVASSVAVAVVAVLLLGWGFWFVHNLKRGGQFNTFIGTTQQEFNPAVIKDVQKQMEGFMQKNTDPTRDLRDAAAAEQVPATLPSSEPSGDQFNVPDNESPSQ